MKNVLLLGATGNLGGLIAAALLQRNAQLRVLVRPGSRAKLHASVAERAEIVEDESAAFHGIDTVISAVQGGPETIIDAQSRWLAAARQAGVKRFIPSDFSYNFWGLEDGENINSDWRRQFARHAAENAGDIEIVHVMNGCFLDHGVIFGFLGAFDLNRRLAVLWGDGQQKMEFTTYADTAAYTAAAALDPNPLPRDFQFAGDSLTFHETVAAIEAALGGQTRLTVDHRGSLADLDAAIAAAQSTEPGNMFAWLPNMYWRGMLNGKGRLTNLQNGRYPEIHPVTVREYVADSRG